MIDPVHKKPTLPKVAVIGCGAWGKNLIRNFAELGTLAAVCDLTTHKAEELASQYGVEALSEEEIFTHPSVEALVIASLAPFHFQQAEAALKAGKHVYVEKPMVLSTKDAKALCTLAKAQNRTFMVGHILNYHPAFIELKKRLPELGPLKHIYANRLGNGRFRRNESVLWDLATHDVSLILSLLQDTPQSVSATEQAYLAGNKPANALLTLTFPQDITAHIHVSWLSPFKEQKLVVIGEKGIAVFDDRNPWSEKLTISKGCFSYAEAGPTANTDFETNTIALPEAEPLKNECIHFLNCIQTGETPRTCALEGLRVTEVLEAAELSLNRKDTL